MPEFRKSCVDTYAYIGGSNFDEGNYIALDIARNIYVAGKTNSDNFPTKSAFQSHWGGNDDAFVLKLSADGSGILYSSYLGGSKSDTGTSIAVDTSGNAYIAGVTASTDFPARNPIQSSLHGGDTWGDAFLAKVDPDGSALVYSTYLGGVRDEIAYGVAVDSADNAYIAGWTLSADFPTANPLQGLFGGDGQNTCGAYPCGGDAFFAKLNAEGSAQVYSTYLGGKDNDFAHGLAVDVRGQAYLTGGIKSRDFPTINAIQPLNAGGFDGFVAKVNSDGSALIYSTYLGGSGNDYNETGQDISVDPAVNAYISGETVSSDFPLANPVQANWGEGFSDAFAVKLDSTGSKRTFSTYLGGDHGQDTGYGVKVDLCGDIYLAGETSSTNFPMVAPIQGVFAGGVMDVFVGKIFFPDITDLSLTKTAAPNPILTGNQLTYHLGS